MMNMSADNITLNSCQYTPVYLVENPGVSQPRSYVLASNNQSEDKPASESLKRFYENSGNLESNLTVTDNTIIPRIIKKNDTNVVGNNLKLASFLLPKCETKNEICKPMITPVNSVMFKPVYIANNFSVNNVNSPNHMSKIDVNSTLVKLKDLPNIVRSQNGKILPKIKPKENSPSSKQKHVEIQPVQPVQLVKFGETYHSLNQLSTDQMKVVNHALKILNTQSNPPAPAYDPATNTKFIYKVISQKDFAEQNKTAITAKRITTEIKKEPIKQETPDTNEEEQEQKVIVEAKVTRSGRVVKLPKNIVVDDSPSKPKKRPNTIVACLQCNSKYSTPQRLHRHYENHPSHTPSNLHNNLFHCLVAMVSAGPEAERTSILLKQLQVLLDRLQACVPCLLKKDDGSDNTRVIGDEIGRLLGISPGKYNLNTEALSCEKDKDGYCSHNPRPQIKVADSIKQQVILENIEDSVSKGSNNILKINFQERRPKILRKVECRKQKLEPSSPIVNGKKIRLTQDISIDKNSNSIEEDDLVALLSDTAKTENKESKVIDKLAIIDQNELEQNTVPKNVEKMNKPTHNIQFHSTHFDIRSSPIKPTSTVFRKFQINPEKMTKYIEIVRPIQLNQLVQDVEMTNSVKNTISDINAQEFFSDTKVITNKKSETLNYTTKSWCEVPSSFIKSNELNGHTDNLIKSNAVIEPALLCVKNSVEVEDKVDNKSELMSSHVQNDVEMVSAIFTKDICVNHESYANNVTNQPNYKPSILIEPLTLAKNHHDSTVEKIFDQSNEFLKPDILIDQALLNSQDCKIIDEITNSSDDYMKSNVIIEPALIHSQNIKIGNFADQTDSFINSTAFIDPALPHSELNNGNRVIGATENNEIDIDLNSSQGQSIISFLESLGNELAYNETETDSRNNVDFQLDLF